MINWQNYWALSSCTHYTYYILWCVCLSLASLCILHAYAVNCSAAFLSLPGIIVSARATASGGPGPLSKQFFSLALVTRLNGNQFTKSPFIQLIFWNHFYFDTFNFFSTLAHTYISCLSFPLSPLIFILC